MGNVLRVQGRNAGALREWQEALKLFVAQGDKRNEAEVRLEIGEMLAAETAELESARGMSELLLSLEIFKRVPDYGGVARAEIAVSDFHVKNGEMDKAFEHLALATRAADQGKDKRLQANAQSATGKALGAVGKHRDALGLHNQAAVTYRELGDRHRESFERQNIAKTLLALGQVDAAVASYLAAKEVADMTDSPSRSFGFGTSLPRHISSRATLIPP